MNHGYVTLDEVFGAAAARAAALAPETSGYLALAIGDATARLPLAIEERAVMLTTEGSVSLARRGDPLPPKQAARGLRELVARLLAVSAGTMPGLAATARPRDESDRGVDAVVEELEAALIPVNRAAARRALARLARETLKAKELGKLGPAAPRPADGAREESAKGAPAPALADIVPVHVLDTAPARDAVPARDAASPTPGLTVPSPEHAVFLAAQEPVTASHRLLEPTPTALGMPAVEIIDPTPSSLLDVSLPTTLDVATAMEFSPTPSDALTLPLARLAPIAPAPAPVPREVATAADVLAPHARELASLSPLPLPVLAPAQSAVLAVATPPPPSHAETPPLPRTHAETPPLPRAHLETPPPPAAPTLAAPILAAPILAAPILAAPILAAPILAAPTRADALLARFGASCDADASVREAAACLKKFAGLDPTPPPPSLGTRPSARAQALPRSSRRDPVELVELVELTPAPPSSAKRSTFGIGTALVFGVLLGAFAVAHARPDLVAVLTARLLAPSAATPAHPARPATDTAAR